MLASNDWAVKIWEGGRGRGNGQPILQKFKKKEEEEREKEEQERRWRKNNSRYVAPLTHAATTWYARLDMKLS